MYKYSFYNIITNKTNGDYLIYNSVSKASFVATESFLNEFLLKNEDIQNLSKDDFEYLNENNFIVEGEKDELLELEYMFHSQYFCTDPLNIVVVPTLACNFDCPYCFEKVAKGFDNKNFFEHFKVFASKTFKKHSCVQLSLFGGEPLVMEKQTLEFLEFVKNDSVKNCYQLKTNIVTNGSLLNDYNMEKLLSYGLFSLQITLDGGKESHNTTRIFKDGRPSFDLLIEKIKLVLKHTKDVQDFMFILRINLKDNSPDDLHEILNHFSLEEKERMSLLIRVIYNTDHFKYENKNSLTELETYYEIALSHGAKIVQSTYYYQTCEACADSRFFYLMPDMTLWKCINDLNHKKACIGKIDTNGEIKIDFENVKHWYNLANCFHDMECRNCKKLPDCYGGCVLHRSKKGKKLCKTFDMACLPYCMNRNE